MNSKINKRQLIGASFIICHLSLSVALTACSDWDDHYQADTQLLSSQESTLWKNISSNEQLSQFASLLKKAGYDNILDATQTYTIWAPVNNTYDYENLSSMDNSRLLHEFVENHIARNNYPASGNMEKRIYTLNEKVMAFNANPARSFESSDASTYVAFIQGISVMQPNLASRNGIMHLLDGKIPFLANIYESLNSNDFAIDSIANYFHSFDEKKLNEAKSVKGPMRDGEITYLDSIFDEHNDLYALFNAYINREDSNYTMIVPTDEAWNKAKSTIRQYYKYLPSFEFMENTSTGSDQKVVNVSIRDVDSLTEATVNEMLMKDLFYNNNLYDNKKLNALKTGETLAADSLYSTTFGKIYTEDAAYLFEDAVRVDKSNGVLWLTDSLRMRTWTTWNPEIILQGENLPLISSVVNVANNAAQRNYVSPGTQNPEVEGRLSNNAYVEFQPLSSGTNPGAVFYLPNVRSTTYSIYLVTVPGNIVNSYYNAKPYRFDVSLGYASSSGKNQDLIKDWTVESFFVSDSARIDTIYLGDFTFPMAYYGTGNYYPYMRINSKVSSRDRNNYDRTLRIDCVILRPKELDNYLKEHPDYKYDRGDY